MIVNTSTPDRFVFIYGLKNRDKMKRFLRFSLNINSIILSIYLFSSLFMWSLYQNVHVTLINSCVNDSMCISIILYDILYYIIMSNNQKIK